MLSLKEKALDYVTALAMAGALLVLALAYFDILIP